ncbi:glycosyltransferase family 4 protein [uncultured Maribacter sp.]|uniref:glycosyltransferase family 4 protein n=1 Tax=uncultured Maribacter sp. TaxID=431308 RepID=UPI00263642FA|nr:glycosyltransferase family 4 protein [uncultured Maribacter sp.]
MSKKVLLISNTSWSINNYRTGLINELRSKGYEIYVLAPYDKYVKNLKKLGCNFVDVKIDAKGFNPFAELKGFYTFYKKIKKISPNFILSYTIKPNLYSSISARILNRPILINITGLGQGFSSENLLKKTLIFVCKNAFRKVNTVFFQNNDDRELFIKNGIVNDSVAINVPGSGANTQYFSPMPKLKEENGKIVFCVITRLLWDKGINEYIKAIEIVKKEYNNVEFQLLGKFDSKDKKAVSEEKIKSWEAKGLINYLGFSDDVRQQIRETDCIVLPSYYREGIPRCLIEAISMGKPIITTNHIGCKEIVEDTVNGFLCEIKSEHSLAVAIKSFLKLDSYQRKVMGDKSREKALNEFDEKIVIAKYINRMQQI